MNVGVRRMIAYAGLLSGLLLLDSKSALSQQNPILTLSTNQVNFFNVPGGGTATQTLTLNTTNSAAVTVNTTGATSWLQVSPNGQINVSSGTPTTLTITATPPTGLAPGSYDSVLSFGVQGSTSAPQTVVVTAFVTGTSILSAKPSSLTFTAQPGAIQATPPTQSVTISSSGAMLDYNATASTTNGQNWLIPFTSTGTTGSAAFAGSPLVIGVNPAGLAAGTYLGQVLVQSATSQDSVTIAVALTVGANSSLTVTPSVLQPFFSQANAAGTSSLTQQLTVTSTSSSANFSVSVNPQVTWLGAAISPPTTTTSSGSSNTITLTVMPIQTPGNYNTTLTITNGATQVSIPISYTVGTGPVPQVTPTQLTFTTSAAQLPASQSVQVSLPAGGNPIGISATSSVPWLSVASSTQLTPVTLTVTADPAGLAAGTYSGTITVRPTNGDQYAIPVNVTLTVTGAPPLLTSGPPVLLFTNQIGQAAPAAQLLQLTSNAQALSFTTSTASTTTANCPANFLQASALSANPSTPSAVAVNVNPTGLTAGMCSGTITVTYGNPGATGPIGSIQVPVIVETSATPLLSLSVPTGFGFETANSCSANSTSGGGTSTPTSTSCSVIMRQITLTSTDGLSPMSFSASAMNNGTIPWLFVAPNSSQTPAVLTVLMNPNGLTPGTYYGSITISSTQSNPSGLPMPVTIPVSFTIRSGSGSGNTVTASVSSLTFNETSGGPGPASQTFTLTSSAQGATYTTTIPSNQNCSWVQLSPMSGAATGTITVGVNSSATSLAQNTYTCSIVLNLTGASNTSIPITATLIVGSGGTGTGIRVTASPTTINFTQTAGGAAPASQTVTLTSSGTGATYTTVLPTTSNCGWLQATPSSGAASGTISVSVASNTLAANSYTCTLTLMLNGAAVASIPITANLTVSAGQTGQSQTITVAPKSLSFNYSAATPQPAAQQMVVSNVASSTTSASFTITAQSSGWLSVTPSSGTAPANITVSANPQNAGTGSAPFAGTITITPAGGGTAITVPVTLNNQ